MIADDAIGSGTRVPEAPEAWARQLFDPRRLFDVTFTLIVLPFALVVGLITALAIWLDSPGPVFYQSRRVGVGGRVFGMLKFRKFHWDATGHPLTMSDDDRFTPIGRFLAVTKLDELPQLWNVLRGEMRLVGPRPEDPEFVSCYPNQYREILKVVPGITGPAALEYAHESHLLRGHKDPVAFYRTELLPRKVAIDLAYAENHSVGGDIAILAKTAILPTKQAIRRVWFTSHHPHAPQAAPRRARRVDMRAVIVAAAGVLLLVSFALASSVQL